MQLMLLSPEFICLFAEFGIMSLAYPVTQHNSNEFKERFERVLHLDYSDDLVEIERCIYGLWAERLVSLCDSLCRCVSVSWTLLLSRSLCVYVCMCVGGFVYVGEWGMGGCKYFCNF